MNLTIKRLSREDFQAGYENCSLFWKMEGAFDNLSRFLTDPHCVMLVCEIDGAQAGQIVGYVLPRWDCGKSMLFLYSIDVPVEYRRLGVGTELIREFNTLGASLGCGKSFVLTDSENSAAMGLYTATGGNRIPSTDVMFQWELGQW